MPQPQKIHDGAQKFRASPKYIQLKAAIPNIDQLLQENNAIIAGSSVLGALVKGGHEWYSDIDLYVSIPNDKQLHTLLRQNAALGEWPSYNTKSSSYCASFMRRNGIRTVVKYHTQEPRAEPWKRLKIDIMAVRKKTTPLNVVQNFDLTFCQVWYDGIDVWATHPNHIRDRMGFLQGDYVPIFLSGNGFLRRRMQKYVVRGFKVSADRDGKELTKDILDDFRFTPNLCIKQKDIVKETGIPWARKTMFRACFGHRRYKGANVYSKEEDGYDSDEYVEDPRKLVDLAGSIDNLIRKINLYLLEVNFYFDSFLCNYEDQKDYALEKFLNPLIHEIKQICGPRYLEVLGFEPEIHLCDEENNSETSLGSEYNGENNNENNAGFLPSRYGREANQSLIPAIPPAMNRAVAARPMYAPPEGTFAPTECFDPYMASMMDIADNQVLFYIFNKPVGNTEPTLSRVACIDNEIDENGQMVQLYRKFLDGINYLYYQCDPSLPMTALGIRRRNTIGEPLRRLAFDTNIYVYESQAKKVQAGRKYALIPTDAKVGRIVSETLLQTWDAVSAEHCQTEYADKIHEIFEMVPAQGGMRFHRLLEKRRKTSKHIKRRKQQKQTRLRRK